MQLKDIKTLLWLNKYGNYEIRGISMLFINKSDDETQLLQTKDYYKKKLIVNEYEEVVFTL